MTKRDPSKAPGKTSDQGRTSQTEERELTDQELGGVAGGVKKTPIPMPQGDEAGVLRGTVKR